MSSHRQLVSCFCQQDGCCFNLAAQELRESLVMLVLKRCSLRPAIAASVATLLLYIAGGPPLINNSNPQQSLRSVPEVQAEEHAKSTLHRRQALMAPIIYPQLYPSCSGVTLPPLLDDGEPRQSAKLSQFGEDATIYDLIFKHQNHTGTFLEIGALDGRTFSNTYFYEAALGWRGILVEPQPENAAKLLVADRPRSARFAVAACNISDDTKPGSLAFTAKGFNVATAIALAATSFLKQWHGGSTVDQVSVPCVPLQYIVDSTGLWDIDFFSLDVEGGERAVLETVDLVKTNIRVMLVELDGSIPEKDEWVRRHLSSYGFERVSAFDEVRSYKNELYLNPRFLERKHERPPVPLRC